MELKQLQGITDAEMTDEEVWWYCCGKLSTEKPSNELKNRFDKLARAVDWC